MIFGLILVVMGLLILGINFGLVQPEIWPVLWRFWPVVLIIIGLVILTKKYIPRWLTILLIIVIVVLALLGALYATSSFWPKTGNYQANQISIDEPLSSDTKKLEATLKLGAQDIDIDATGSGLVSGNINSFGSEPKYDFSRNGSTAKVDIYQTWSMRNVFKSDTKSSKSNIYLSNQIPVDLVLQMGATNINADLSEIIVQRLTVKSGALQGDIRIGTKSDKVNIDVAAGASGLNLYIPKDLGCKTVQESGVSKIKYDNMNMHETRDSRERKSVNYDSSAKTVNVIIKAGASSIKLIGY